MPEIHVYRANHTLDADESQIRAKEFVQKKQTFDADGNLLQECNYQEDGLLEHEYRYAYDERGNIVEEKLIEGPEMAGHRTFAYDDNNRRITETVHYLDGSEDTTHFVYNGAGQVVSYSTTDSDGEPGISGKKEYENGLLTHEVELDAFGELSLERHVEYNLNGLPVVEIAESTEGYSRKTLEYDSQNRLILQKTYNRENQLAERLRFEYGPSGNVSCQVEENKDGIETTILSYDPAGNIVSQLTTGADDEPIQEITREFDGQNRPVVIEVVFTRPGSQVPLHYRLRYEYF